MVLLTDCLYQVRLCPSLLVVDALSWWQEDIIARKAAHHLQHSLCAVVLAVDNFWFYIPTVWPWGRLESLGEWWVSINTFFLIADLPVFVRHNVVFEVRSKSSELWVSFLDRSESAPFSHRLCLQPAWELDFRMKFSMKNLRSVLQTFFVWSVTLSKL